MPPEKNISGRNIIITVIIILILAAGATLFFSLRGNDTADVNTEATTTQDGQSNANIVVRSPRANERVGNPIIIVGDARVFEGTVNYRLRDASGTEIAKGFTTANSLNASLLGNFRGELLYATETDERGTLEVFSISAENGTEINMVTIPIFYSKTPDFIKG